MRRHTVGIAHPDVGAAAPPADMAHYFTPHHHHHQPGVAAGPLLLHPPLFTPGVAATHGLPHLFMPHDLSVHSASEDEALPANMSAAIADHNLLRPPQIPGMTSRRSGSIFPIIDIIIRHRSQV